MKRPYQSLALSLCLAVLSTACKNKSDSPGVAAPPPAQTTQVLKDANAQIHESADGTAMADLQLPGANGVLLSHKGKLEKNRESELRSDDGKSLASVQAYDGFGILMVLQYQADRSDAQLYILARNQNSSYSALLSGLAMDRNTGLSRARAALDETGIRCRLSLSQAVASLSQYFAQNPRATLEQFLESRRQEISTLKEGQKCQSPDLATGTDGKVQIKSSTQTSPTGGSAPTPDSSLEPIPSTPRISLPPVDVDPIEVSNPVQKQEVSVPAAPAQPEVTPQPPSDVPSEAQPVTKAVVADSHGYHTNWEVCYASGKWKTDGNMYCKQTWWPNCSPESGGHKCKASSAKK